MNDSGTVHGSGRWFHCWNVVAAALCSNAFAVGFTSGCFAVLLLPLEQSLQTTRFQVQLAVSALFYSMVLLSPLVPMLIRLTSVRSCMLVGIGTLSAGLMLLSFVTTPLQLQVTYALLLAAGTTFAGMIPCTTLAVNWFVRRRGRAVGLVAVGASIGGFIAPPVVAWLIAQFDWRHACQLLSIGTLLVMVPMLLFVIVDRPEDRGQLPDGDAVRASAAAPLPATAMLSVAQILRNPTYWIVSLSIGLGSMIYKGVLMNMVPISLGRGVDPLQASWLIAVLTVCMIPGKLFIGIAADRARASTMLVVVLLASALGVALIAVSTGVSALIAGAILVGLGSGGYGPLVGIIVGGSFQRAFFAKAMGWVMPVVYLLTAPGGAIAGYIYDRYHSYLPAMWLFVGVLLVVTVAALSGRRWIDAQAPA